jgi:hypothetical protein
MMQARQGEQDSQIPVYTHNFVKLLSEIRVYSEVP